MVVRLENEPSPGLSSGERRDQIHSIYPQGLADQFGLYSSRLSSPSDTLTPPSTQSTNELPDSAAPQPAEPPFPWSLDFLEPNELLSGIDTLRDLALMPPTNPPMPSNAQVDFPVPWDFAPHARQGMFSSQPWSSSISDQYTGTEDHHPAAIHPYQYIIDGAESTTHPIISQQYRPSSHQALPATSGFNEYTESTRQAAPQFYNTKAATDPPFTIPMHDTHGHETYTHTSGYTHQNQIRYG